MMANILEYMEELGYLTQTHHQELELEVLYAFIDGLVIHALQSPEQYTEERLDQLVEYYLYRKKIYG